MVLEKIFEGFLKLYGHGGNLGFVISIMLLDLTFLVPKSLVHIKFGLKWTTGFLEKPVLIFICKRPWAKVKK